MAKQDLDINSLNELDNDKQGFIPKIKEKISALLAKLKKLDKKQKILVFGGLGGAVFLFLLLCVLLIVLLSKPSAKTSAKTQEKIEKVAVNKDNDDEEELPAELLQSLPKMNSVVVPIDNKELNGMIQKADMLYANGNVLEALNVYDKIANFSQSLASYNLGVVRLRQKEYQAALKSFEQSIDMGEDVSLNAFNAAISARYMNDKKTYEYYLNLAAKELTKENQEAFYSYLYALIQFYNQNYFATLSALAHPNSDAFVSKSDDLLVKTFLIFNDYENAINILEKDAAKDYKTLGLLYARMGDYLKARQYLLRYTNKNPEDHEAQMALQIVFLKMRDYASAAKGLEPFLEKKEVQKQVLDTYPIKVVLHPKLFDVNLAQEIFVKSILEPQDLAVYKILFYYAPFKVFNIRDALGKLNQGGILSSKNIQATEEKVIEGQTVAHIDKNIAEALIYVNQKKLRKALKVLESVLEKNPNHSILHYNAGLLYAQMENYAQAYKHFMKAYHLNTKELDSAMYAIVASYFLGKDATRMQNDITKKFEELVTDNPEKRKFLLAFFGYLNNNIADEMLWINQAKDQKSVYYALKAAYAIRSKNQKALVDSFAALKQIYKDDFITDIFYAVAQDFNSNFKQTVLKLHNQLTKKIVNLDSVFYGPALAREFYAYIGYITGSLQNQENVLQEKLTSTLEDTNGILQALALVNIYQHKFEQAYDLYNILINKLNEADAHTQFLAAVAAMGIDDKNNATLLLQLSKMESDSEFEARLVLGMLYQQEGNLQSAITHYNMLVGKTFDTNFFDFEIDTQKILNLRKQVK